MGTYYFRAPRVMPYDREKAVAYAHKWANGRNPAYFNFEGYGGDCTNFASQVIFSGSGVMNYTPTHGWYYVSSNKRTPAWTDVDLLYKFLVNNNKVGPFAERTAVEDMEVGDFIQLSFVGGNDFNHTLMVVQTGERPSIDNILIATHTNDRDNHPLGSYTWKDIRFIHLLGVRR